MKTLSALFFLCYLVSSGFAQTPQTVEADLLKSFKKIEYWDLQQSRGIDYAIDSLRIANIDFGSKLKKYTGTRSFTINQPFNSLKKLHVNIVSSTDGLFRIYSWDTQLGGTMRSYKTLFQYRTSNGIKSEFATYETIDGGSVYLKLFTVKTQHKTYYMGLSTSVLGSAFYAQFINAFAVENDRLNKKVKIIKTENGFDNNLSAALDRTSSLNINLKDAPDLSFDAKTETIHVPLVLKNGRITGKYVDYKFNGQYFEKIKS